MPTRKKNRLNKKGKRRNISRKMRGGGSKVVPITNNIVTTISDDEYSSVGIEMKDDISLIFYRLHDVELIKTFYEELLRSYLNKEKVEAAKVEGKEGKEEAAKIEAAKVEAAKVEEVKKEIENKLKELLSKIYSNYWEDPITTNIHTINDTINKKADKDNDKINVINVLTGIIFFYTKKIKDIKNIESKNKIIINKIITSKIEEESNKPEYTENMTREHAKKILHVYDEKNSKEIKYKYKMTKDMWTDISTRVTENDRKPLIKKILNKVEKAYDVLYQDKETTIDINFYKSIFGKNPFPYRELINVTRTGEGVTPMIYGVEDLFKLYEDELKYIKDNKPNNAVKPPFKQKKIEIIHKRKNPEFPSIFEPN